MKYKLICLYVVFVSAFLSIISTAAGEIQSVVTYSPGFKGPGSAVYAVTTNDRPVYVDPFRTIEWCHFSADFPCSVTVKAKKQIKKHTIRPFSKKIKTDVNGTEMTFQLEKPGQLVIEASKGKLLFLFADAHEKNAPKPGDPNVVNIADFVSDTSGRKTITDEIQGAINRARPGSVLYFPPGVYKTATLYPKSDTHIYFAPGAMLLGSSDREDYKDKTDSLFMIENARNVRFSGRGVLDANGTELRENGQRGNLIRAFKCENLVFEDLVFRNSPTWNTRLINCDNVEIRNVKIMNDTNLTNTDGFDPDNCRHVLIENCFAYCGDDPVVIKSSSSRGGQPRDVYDVMIRGNILMTRKNAMKVGTESKAKRMYDITFVDNDVLWGDRGMSVCCRDGADMYDIRFINNRFEDWYRAGGVKERIVDFYIEHRAGKGRIRDILIRDCTALFPWPQPPTMLGLDVEHTISNVRFENFVVGAAVCENARDAQLKTNEFVENVIFYLAK